MQLGEINYSRGIRSDIIDVLSNISTTTFSCQKIQKPHKNIFVASREVS